MDLPFLKPAQAEVVRRFVQSGALRELLMFLLIGGTGAILYVLLNTTFLKLGFAPYISIAMTVGILIPPVYYLQHTLTFRSGRNHLSAFPRYAGAQLFGNVIAIGFAYLLPGPIKAYPFTASFLIAAIVAALNYGILKFWAFRHTPVSAN